MCKFHEQFFLWRHWAGRRQTARLKLLVGAMRVEVQRRPRCKAMGAAMLAAGVCERGEGRGGHMQAALKGRADPG